MKVTRLAGLAGLLVILTGSARPARASDPTPEDVLAGRGLTKEGKFFVLSKVEDEVKAQLNQVIPLVGNLNLLFDQWAANEQKKYMVGALAEEIAICRGQQQYVQSLYSQVSRTAAVARMERQQLDQMADALRQYIGQLQNQRNLVQSQIASDLVQQAHLKKVAKAREVFLQAYGEMNPATDRLKAAYSEVGQDEKVINALKVLRESKKIQFKLGPSDAIMKPMAVVNDAKRTLDPQYFQPTRFKSSRPKGIKTKPVSPADRRPGRRARIDHPRRQAD